MKISLKFLFTLLAGAALVISCSKDDDNTPNDDDGGTPLGNYENGYFVLNEGNFGNSNASVSFVGDNGLVQNQIFQTVNGTSLGDMAQSMGIEDNFVYIVVNGSNTIEVVNRYTFESITTISSGLSNPRYIVFENNKGYVSNWGDPMDPNDDYIAVINLNTNTVENSIPVAEGPEKMLEENGKLYVAHKGGWGYGNTVSVINLTSETLAASIEVDDVPDSLVEEDGFLYVLCSGKPEWSGEETPGTILKINLSNNQVVDTFGFADLVHPENLVESNGSLYFTLGSSVYRKFLNAAGGIEELFSVDEQGVYGIYGFEVEDNIIYIADAKDYNSNGEVLLYTTTGEPLNTYTVGIIPNGFYFND